MSVFKFRFSFKRKGIINIYENLRFYSEKNEKPIHLQKCLVFSKFCRYDYERYFLQQYNDHEAEKILRNRGLNYDQLIEHKNKNKKFEELVAASLIKAGIDTKIVNRMTCTKDLIDWADAIIPTGGDGTFLLAASKIKDNKKPVIGFNSDPLKSEGYLCLPKKYTSNVDRAVENLLKGNFKWQMRSRIRITVIAKHFNKPIDLHQISDEALYEFDPQDHCAQLPVLALNEVFVGECLSARASLLDLSLNDSQDYTKIKSSGICISTGTGSTSWYYSINRVSYQCVAELLRLLDLDSKSENYERSLATRLADIYNKNLIFNPDDPRLAYSVRDMIVAGVWPSPKGIEDRAFAKKIRLRSYCFDAGLVVDGNVSFPFNNGSEAIFEILPHDALRTVVMID